MRDREIERETERRGVEREREREGREKLCVSATEGGVPSINIKVTSFPTLHR